MVFADNHATSEGSIDKVGERLLRPFRFRESVGIERSLDKVRIDSFLPTACGLRPQRLRLFTAPNVVSVPGIVQVPGRDATEEEHIVRLGRQSQAKALNLPARKEAHYRRGLRI
jgi:hypothetical protein